MWWRCVHLNRFIVVTRIDVVVQADGIARALIELRFSQLVANIRVLFLVLQKLRQLKIYFRSALIFKPRALSSLQSFKERFCGETRGQDLLELGLVCFIYHHSELEQLLAVWLQPSTSRSMASSSRSHRLRPNQQNFYSASFETFLDASACD